MPLTAAPIDAGAQAAVTQSHGVNHFILCERLPSSVRHPFRKASLYPGKETRDKSAVLLLSGKRMPGFQTSIFPHGHMRNSHRSSSSYLEELRQAASRSLLSI